MSFRAPIRRVDRVYRGKPTHHYEDADGRRIPGVTTILSDGMPKPALVNWAGNATAEYAVNRWDELADLPPADRLKRLRGARYEDRDAAARRGTEVHRIAEHLLHGEDVEVPAELTGHVESYLQFLRDWDPVPVLVEATVYHLAYGWAGTLDLVAELADGRRWLLDVKTTRSGVYGETAYQLAMYRYSQSYLDADGAPQPMPEVDATGVIWVRADGYDLIPLRADEHVLTEARHIARVARAAADCGGYVGEALIPVRSAS